MSRFNNNILRRFRKADRLLQTDFFIMRPCFYYFTRDFLCIFSPESPYCERYFRVNR
jgi:hypothetical protein